MDNYTDSKNNSRTPGTVIGLGLMGSAIANALLKAGHPTTVWNRTAEKAGRLVHQGATRADTVAQAVSASPVVVVCVSTYEAVREILGTAGDALAGRTLVNLTTGTPEQAREMAAWAAALRADYLDGAIMASPPMIGTPDAMLLYSGSEHAVEEHRAVFASLGQVNDVGADPGLASVYDAALLGMMYLTVFGFLHALALMRAEGVEPTKFLPFASGWLQNVASFLPGTAREVEVRAYTTDIATLNVDRAALDHIVSTSTTAGISAEAFGVLVALADRGIAAGHGDHSFSSLAELMQEPTEAE